MESRNCREGNIDCIWKIVLQWENLYIPEWNGNWSILKNAVSNTSSPSTYNLALFSFLLVYGIGFFIDGYYIQDEKIVYYHNFKRRKKDLSEVKSVIISNTYLYRRNLRVNIYKNGKFVHCPWITLFFEEIDAGLLVKDRKELNTLKVEHQLYKNCSKYGFIYKNNMDKFLMNFTGEVYIAKTVYLNFEEEMKKLFGSKVIYIIPDTGGEN